MIIILALTLLGLSVFIWGMIEARREKRRAFFDELHKRMRKDMQTKKTPRFWFSWLSWDKAS